MEIRSDFLNIPSCVSWLTFRVLSPKVSSLNSELLIAWVCAWRALRESVRSMILLRQSEAFVLTKLGSERTCWSAKSSWIPDGMMLFWAYERLYSALMSPVLFYCSFLNVYNIVLGSPISWPSWIVITFCPNNSFIYEFCCLVSPVFSVQLSNIRPSRCLSKLFWLSMSSLMLSSLFK